MHTIIRTSLLFLGIICNGNSLATENVVRTSEKQETNAQDAERQARERIFQNSERILQHLHRYNSISFICEDEWSSDKKQWKSLSRRELFWDTRRNSLILKIADLQHPPVTKNIEWDDIIFIHNGIQTIFRTGRLSGRGASALIIKSHPFFYAGVMPLNLYSCYDNKKNIDIEKFLKQKDGISFTEVIENGKLLLKLQKGNATFYFNQQSGLLIRKIRDDSIRKEREIIEVNSYSLMEGKSVPMLIETKLVDTEGNVKNGFVRHRLIPQSVRINQEIPEAAFTAKFPQGTQVFDKIKNDFYTTQGEILNDNTEEVANVIDKMIDAIKEDDKK